MRREKFYSIIPKATRKFSDEFDAWPKHKKSGGIGKLVALGTIIGIGALLLTRDTKKQ